MCCGQPARSIALQAFDHCDEERFAFARRRRTCELIEQHQARSHAVCERIPQANDLACKRRKQSANGVVVAGDPELDPEGLVVDLDATATLRASLREAPG